MRSGNFGEKKRWKVEFDWSKSVWGDLHKNDFRENRREVFFPFDKRLKNEQINNLNLHLNVFNFE